MGSVATGRDVRAMATAHLEEEARRFTRRTRFSMAVEGVLALALGGVGLGVLGAGEAATATVAAAMFAAGAVYSPVGAWDMNLAGIFLPVVIALAGFVQFVFLGSAHFVSEPSDVP